MSKELHKTDVEPASSKPAPKTEGATIAKQGIKVQGVGFFLFVFFLLKMMFVTISSDHG